MTVKEALIWAKKYERVNDCGRAAATLADEVKRLRKALAKIEHGKDQDGFSLMTSELSQIARQALLVQP